MCGIVGLFAKSPTIEANLGALLGDMLVTMTDRGPDSAGIAVYGSNAPGRFKISLQSSEPDVDFNGLDAALSDEIRGGLKITLRSTHAILDVPADEARSVVELIERLRPQVRIMSQGEVIEIYKEVGLPETVVTAFDIGSMRGSHGIGHTRMATESRVTTMGAHPFSTGYDQCLVHNGSLSNHNRLRRKLARNGVDFETENDSEVAAAYLTYEMSQGATLDQALTRSLDDLDGFYTFLVGTKSGFGVVRDPIACKPAVMAETDDYVAFGSEYRALVGLPGIEKARVWEPAPAQVYFWEH